MQREDVFTVFSAELSSQDGTPVIDVPNRELAIGDLELGETYRVAIYPRRDSGAVGGSESATTSGQRVQEDGASPPVKEGDALDVEIEDIGEQGDGIARIGPGYVVFVPETGVGDRVTIRITEARDNFAFAEVVEPEPLSD